MEPLTLSVLLLAMESIITSYIYYMSVRLSRGLSDLSRELNEEWPLVRGSWRGVFGGEPEQSRNIDDALRKWRPPVEFKPYLSLALTCLSIPCMAATALGLLDPILSALTFVNGLLAAIAIWLCTRVIVAHRCRRKLLYAMQIMKGLKERIAEASKTLHGLKGLGVGGGDSSKIPLKSFEEPKPDTLYIELPTIGVPYLPGLDLMSNGLSESINSLIEEVVGGRRQFGYKPFEAKGTPWTVTVNRFTEHSALVRIYRSGEAVRNIVVAPIEPGRETFRGMYEYVKPIVFEVLRGAEPALAGKRCSLILMPLIGFSGASAAVSAIEALQQSIPFVVLITGTRGRLIDELAMASSSSVKDAWFKTDKFVEILAKVLCKHPIFILRNEASDAGSYEPYDLKELYPLLSILERSLEGQRPGSSMVEPERFILRDARGTTILFIGRPIKYTSEAILEEQRAVEERFNVKVEPFAIISGDEEIIQYGVKIRIGSPAARGCIVPIFRLVSIRQGEEDLLKKVISTAKDEVTKELYNVLRARGKADALESYEKLINAFKESYNARDDVIYPLMMRCGVLDDALSGRDKFVRMIMGGEAETPTTINGDFEKFKKTLKEAIEKIRSPEGA